MKRLISLALFAALLAGCVAVPVADPGPVYVAPAPVVVRPYFYYGYEGHEGFHHEHHWH